MEDFLGGAVLVGMGMSGFAKRASSWDAWAEVGVRARRFKGRRERGSEDVGIDSGMGSDILEVSEVWGLEIGKGLYRLK